MTTTIKHRQMLAATVVVALLAAGPAVAQVRVERRPGGFTGAPLTGARPASADRLRAVSTRPPTGHGVPATPARPPARQMMPRPVPQAPPIVHRPPSHTTVAVSFGFHQAVAVPSYPMVAAPVVVSEPVYVAPPPVIVEPAPVIVQTVAPAPVVVQTVAPAPVVAAPPAGTVVFQGVISDRRSVAPKGALTTDGVAVKVKDTHRRPLTADLEVGVDDYANRYKRLPIGSRIQVHGRSGQLYSVDITDINDDLEAVTIVVSVAS